jgi:hypothetical protein
VVNNNPLFIQQNGDGNVVMPNYGTITINFGKSKEEAGWRINFKRCLLDYLLLHSRRSFDRMEMKCNGAELRNR